MTPLEIRALKGSGAEVVGADVTQLTVGDWNQLEAAFAAFGALVFREQMLDARTHLDFAKRWGPIVNQSQASMVQNAHVDVADPGRNTQPSAWTSGDSYRHTPSLGAATFARRLVGDVGPTRLTSLTTAFDALTTTTQRELEGLTARHHGPDDRHSSHPLVIVHPLSGRKTLYVNPEYTTGVDGIADLEGLALINQLTEHCQRDEFVGEFDWEAGTLLLVDHRCVWQFDHGMGESLLQTATIEGDELMPARQPDRREPTIVERAGATIAGGVITAAMAGIAEVVEPEKARSDIEIVAEAPEQEPLTPLDFGDLPPLD